MISKTSEKKKEKKQKKESFEEWLKKNPKIPMTSYEIEKGLKSDNPYVVRMAKMGKKMVEKAKKKSKAMEDNNQPLIQPKIPMWNAW